MKGKPQRARLGDLLRPQLPPVSQQASETVATATASSPRVERDVQKQLNVLISLDVHRRAKAKASLKGVTLGAVAERLLRDWLDNQGN